MYEARYMELCTKLKNNFKCVIFFRILKEGTLCFVDRAANPWPSLIELNDVVT